MDVIMAVIGAVSLLMLVYLIYALFRGDEK